MGQAHIGSLSILRGGSAEVQGHGEGEGVSWWTLPIFSFSFPSEVVVVVAREDRDEMGKGDFQKQYRAGRQVMDRTGRGGRMDMERFDAYDSGGGWMR